MDAALDYVHDGSANGAAVEIRLSFIAKAHGSCDTCEEGVVRAHSDISARADLRAALADDDLADCHFLSIGALKAEVFRV